MVDKETQKLLTHINPRRFALLLQAVRMGSTFTAPDFKEIYPSESSSLTRDLNALEAAGLLLASPPMSEPRQGQRVVYQVVPDLQQRFQQLADAVSQACTKP